MPNQNGLTRRKLIAIIGFLLSSLKAMGANMNTAPQGGIQVKLPGPPAAGGLDLNEALQKRRSIRSYLHEQLSLGEVSQLLWAAQGLSSPEGFRTAPSAGALYPLEVYLAAGSVAELAAGIYRYEPVEHVLMRSTAGDRRKDLATAALGQDSVGKAAVDLIITAVYERTTVKYGRRGIRYVHLEAGHAAQNVLLMATSLNLGAVPVGAFDDAAVAEMLQLPGREKPLYLIPVGQR
jgi:SagB-type dehydrogenase family enzyme